MNTAAGVVAKPSEPSDNGDLSLKVREGQLRFLNKKLKNFTSRIVQLNEFLNIQVTDTSGPIQTCSQP